MRFRIHPATRALVPVPPHAPPSASQPPRLLTLLLAACGGSPTRRYCALDQVFSEELIADFEREWPRGRGLFDLDTRRPFVWWASSSSAPTRAAGVLEQRDRPDRLAGRDGDARPLRLPRRRHPGAVPGLAAPVDRLGGAGKDPDREHRSGRPHGAHELRGPADLRFAGTCGVARPDRDDAHARSRHVHDPGRGPGRGLLEPHRGAPAQPAAGASSCAPTAVPTLVRDGSWPSPTPTPTTSTSPVRAVPRRRGLPRPGPGPGEPPSAPSSSSTPSRSEALSTERPPSASSTGSCRARWRSAWPTPVGPDPGPGRRVSTGPRALEFVVTRSTTRRWAARCRAHGCVEGAVLDR